MSLLSVKKLIFAICEIIVHTHLIDQKMKLAIFFVTLVAFANLANGKVLSDPVKSYENHQVLRVKIDSEKASNELSEILGVTFWNEGRIGGYADIMVAPQDITQVTENLKKQAFDFSTMVENVGDLIRLEKVGTFVSVKKQKKFAVQRK